mmetsp:Transcript_3046/g.6802  ORF Transcript_3046/g.6802 Transcript_3046/m.6802 type:complete len:240 (-) Transcript_3046:218-937(-)
MIADSMTIYVFKDPEVSNALINCFMSRPDTSFHCLDFLFSIFVRCVNLDILAFVSEICFYLFTLVESKQNGLTRSSDVILATSKRTVHPHHMTSLYADPNFVTQSATNKPRVPPRRGRRQSRGGRRLRDPRRVARGPDRHGLRRAPLPAGRDARLGEVPLPRQARPHGPGHRGPDAPPPPLPRLPRSRGRRGPDPVRREQRPGPLVDGRVVRGRGPLPPPLGAVRAGAGWRGGPRALPA